MRENRPPRSSPRRHRSVRALRWTERYLGRYELLALAHQRLTTLLSPTGPVVSWLAGHHLGWVAVGSVAACWLSGTLLPVITAVVSTWLDRNSD